MSTTPNKGTPAISPGKIYRDVYTKRAHDQHVEKHACEQAELEVAHMAAGNLVFASASSCKRALGAGVFWLAIPDGLDIAAGDEFARQFYLGPSAMPYGRFRDLGPEIFGDPLLGFHQRVNQIEQFLLERRFWDSYFPPEIRHLGERLTSLSRQILRSVLTNAGVPAAEWPRATGGCSEAAGSYHLTLNHYRPELAQVGLNSHKDDGFVTVLRATSAGLEVNRENQWEAVPSDLSYFVVNFGLAMQLLTAKCDTPVAAIMHRVAHQDADRSSFGHFSSSRCEPGADDGIYQYLPGCGLERVCGSRELIEVNDYEIYEGTDVL